MSSTWTLRCLLTTLLTLLLPPVLCSCSSTPSDSEILESIRDTTLIPMLGSYKEEEQHVAIQQFLSNLDRYPEEISKILVTSLGDPVYSERTKLVAACLLALLRDDRGIEVLINNLSAESEGTQDLVRRHLSSYGPRIMPVVAEILDTGNTRARLNAAVVLDDLALEHRVKDCYERMWDRLEHEPDSQVRFVLLTGIARDDRAVAARRLLLSLSREKDDLNREIAWGALRERLEIPSELVFDPAATVEVRAEQIRLLQNWLSQRPRH